MEKYSGFGVYAYRELATDIVFYVGRQSESQAMLEKGYLRAYDFYGKRNARCTEHIKEIGLDSFEVMWLYKTNDREVSLFSIELKFQELYYNIYKDNFLCAELLIGKFNPNYENKWSPEKRRALSDKKRRLKQSANEKNGATQECVLISPEGKAISFSMMKTMRKWININLNNGEDYFPLKYNKPHDVNLSHVRHNRRELSEKMLGWKYMYKEDYIDKCGETIETHYTHEEVE